MRQCKKCGGILEDNAKFCIVCGDKVEPPLEKNEIIQQPTDGMQEQIQPQDTQLQQLNSTNYPTAPQIIQVEEKNESINETSQIQSIPDSSIQQDISNTQQNIIQQNTVQQSTMQMKTVDNLNNPANNPSNEIVIPSHANIDVNSNSYTATPTFQSMPEIQDTSKEEETLIVPKDMSKNMAQKRRRQKKIKNAKVIYIIAGIVAGLFVLTIIAFLIAFFISYKETVGDKPTHKLELNEKNSYRVGSRDYGYVSVPNSWTPFGITPENQTIQYSDGAGWIVTLFSVGKENITATEWANSIVNQMNSVGATDIGKEEIEINNFKGYKTFGYYGSVSTYLAAWVLECDDGKVHYIAIEGPNRYDDYYDIVYTFNTIK